MVGGSQGMEFIQELAAPTPAPGAGGALAASATMAAALGQMTAGISIERGGAELDDEQLSRIVARAKQLREQVSELGAVDADAYAAVIEAMRIDSSNPARGERVQAALSAAAEPPLRICEFAADIAELVGQVVAGGRYSVRGDALAGVLLAEAAACGASRLVEIDVAEASDPRVARAAMNAERAAVARARALRV